MSRKLLLMLGVVVLAAAGVIIFVLQRDPGGAPTPQAAVTEYIAALEAQDRARLERLADPDHDASAEISSRLARFGGAKLVVSDTRIATTESDVTNSVDITATVDGTPYTETLWLYGHAEGWPGKTVRWFVALGPNRNAHPK